MTNIGRLGADYNHEEKEGNFGVDWDDTDII